MTPKENEQGSHQHQEGSQEQERTPYYRVARFRSEESAGKAYFQTQDVIYKDPDCELSAHRIQLNRIYHVAVLGDRPSPALDKNLQEILSAGESVSLPPDALKLLLERRAKAIKKGPWVERHHRPGKNL